MKNVIVNSSPMAINCFEHEMFPEITLKSNVLAIYFTVSLAVRTWPATANGLATETLKKKNKQGEKQNEVYFPVVMTRYSCRHQQNRCERKLL